MADRGDHRQRYQRHLAELEAAQPQPRPSSAGSTQANLGDSKLAAILIEKWCWGSLSPPMLQCLAAAAVEDGLEQPLIRPSSRLLKMHHSL